MVKIPELAKDGQNWKIYCTKFLKVAATFDCLKVLAGRPYEGDDWDGCNALLCCMFMETVAPSIYFKIRRRTAHEIFKYLAKRFCDNDPIPCANELQCTGTATAAEMPDNCPTSADAATERHAHAKSDEEDLTTTTQDLTQGTQDVNDGNVGCTQDPRTSFEDSAKGTSAKCIKMTPVILESMPHKMQDRPQDSLQATPYACEQEAADSVVTAGHTNGTAKMAKPNVVDIDGKAALGRDLAERVHIVDEGGEERKPPLRLQQIKFYCREIDQHSGIANGDVPITNGLPLEGEWAIYPSGDAGREVKPMDSSNELKTLIILSMESEDPGGGGIPHVHLGN